MDKVFASIHIITYADVCRYSSKVEKANGLHAGSNPVIGTVPREFESPRGYQGVNMIFLRLGKTTAPIPQKCTFCPRVVPAFDTLFFQETDAILSDKNHDREFETMCPRCYNTIKDAAIKHKVPVEFDYQIPLEEGVRQATNTKTREF